MSQGSGLCNRFPEFEGLESRASRSRKSKRIEDTERGKINKFKGTTVFSGGRRYGTASSPRAESARRRDAIKAQRVVAAVHAEDIRDFFRRDYTLWFWALFPLPSLSADSLKRRRRTHFHYSAISFRWFFFFVCECRERAVRKCRRCATKMHRQVGVTLWEYVASKANIMLARSTQETRIEAVGQNFRKFQYKKGFLWSLFFRQSESDSRPTKVILLPLFLSILFFY